MVGSSDGGGKGVAVGGGSGGKKEVTGRLVEMSCLLVVVVKVLLLCWCRVFLVCVNTCGFVSGAKVRYRTGNACVGREVCKEKKE